MEGKKSFVLYTDIIHTVRKLPKDKQADLFLMILGYVNDENPTTNDILLEVAFEPIKRQLKRDLVKYEERAKRSRENGKTGGRPPKDDNPKEPKEPSGLLGNPENPSEPRKPDSVNGTDTVIDTVNGNDIEGSFVFQNQDSKEVLQLSKEIGSFFQISEISNPNQFMKIGNFVRCLESKRKLDHLEKQFKGYKAVKNDGKFIHSIENYMGSTDKSYEDGQWNSKLWYKNGSSQQSVVSSPKRLNRNPT